MVPHAQAVLVLLLMCTASMADVFTAQQTTDLIHFVDTLMQCRGIVGLSVAVVKGSESWTRGFGLADRETGRNVSSSDLFAIGSLTKAFTSALISLFINDTSRYSWDTPIVDILGQDFEFATEDLTRQLNLKDILTHRTGLENTDLPLFALSNWTTSEYARRLKYLPVKNLFRDKYDYNNWMYGLAGHVAEVMGGAPWEDLVHTHLLRPLGMSHTAVLGKTLSVRADSLAKPYVMYNNTVKLSDPEIYRITPLEASGAIASSAEDMAKWMQMIVSGGRTQQGVPLLSGKHLEEMTSPHVSLNWWTLRKSEFPVTSVTYGYGMGWYTGIYRDSPMVWHPGSVHAFSSNMVLFPHEGLGLYIGKNGVPGVDAYHFNNQAFFYIADLLLGKKPWLNTTNACRYPDLWQGRSPVHTPSTATVYHNPHFQSSEQYAGCYQHDLFGKVNVTKNGPDGLYVRYGFLEGQVYRTRAENVAMVEVVGSMAFEFRPGVDPGYLRLSFAQPVNGVYEEVALRTSSSPDPVVFRRDAKCTFCACQC